MYIRSKPELGGMWDSILNVAQKGFEMFTGYQASKTQSEQERYAMQLQHEVSMAQLEAQKEAAAAAAEAQKTQWQVMLETMKAKTAAVDWGRIAKIALPVAGIGVGVWLLVRKRRKKK